MEKNSSSFIPGTDPKLMGKGSVVAIVLGFIGIAFYIFLILLWMNDHKSGQDSVGLPVLILFGCLYLPAAVYVLSLGFRKKSQANDMQDEIFNISLNDQTINLGAMLFLIPVEFGEAPVKLEKPDFELHFNEHDAKMYKQDAMLFCSDLPKSFVPAKVPNAQLMHYQTLMSQHDGQRYMPLFTSYKIMTSIYGENIRVGEISFATARKFVVSEKLDGIVFSPGLVNKVITAEELC